MGKSITATSQVRELQKQVDILQKTNKQLKQDLYILNNSIYYFLNAKNKDIINQQMFELLRTQNVDNKQGIE